MSARRCAGVVALATLCAAGCGGGTESPVAAPPTTASTLPPLASTVPPFGLPSTVLPPTSANATANATGACGAFSVFFTRAAAAPLSTTAADQLLAPATQFAGAAASGAPSQWGQLQADVSALVAAVASPAFAASAAQDSLPAVAQVELDCRPLQ